MVSSEVQRTLVKSPPELWAEISDPESLARHLGEFGEIRITRVQPEQKVEWEADAARGTVVIKPSGWGTKVKLTVTRELALVARDDAAAVDADAADVGAEAADVDAKQVVEVEPNVEVERAVEVEPIAAVEPATEAPASDSESSEVAEAVADGPVNAEPEPALEPGHASEPDPEPALEPEQRPGFFARLFGRRRPAPAQPAPPAPAPDPEAGADSEAGPTFAAEPDDDPVDQSLADAATEVEAEAEVEIEAGASEQGEMPLEESPDDGHEDGRPDIAAELAAAEEIAAEQVTAVLTGVLDRLGAAHHRPFSRS